MLCRQCHTAVQTFRSLHMRVVGLSLWLSPDLPCVLQPAASMAVPQTAAAFAAYDVAGAGAAPKKAIPEWLRDEMKKRVLDGSGASAVVQTPALLTICMHRFLPSADAFPKRFALAAPLCC